MNADYLNWSFGDGSTFSGNNPTHTYTTAKNYTVSLNATNYAGTATMTRNDYIRVVPLMPQAYFDATPVFGTTPLPVSFINSTTMNADSLSWSFGDGVTSSANNPTNTYTITTDNQTFTISLKATNTAGSNTMNRTISVYATPPVNVTAANFTESQPIITSPIIEFNGSSSSNVTKYEWDFGDGQKNYTAQPVHTYANPGTYMVTLTTTNYDISSNGVYSTPVVYYITPQNGPTGTDVTIYGYNFINATDVKFGTTSGTDLHVVDSGTITIKSPAGSAGTAVYVTVVNPYYESTTAEADKFTYT